MGDSTITAYVGLGANIGERRATMQAAVYALDEHPRIRVDLASGIASLYETSPVGGPGEQPWYLNSAVRAVVDLSPKDLLQALLAIETSLGRAREERWGNRLIDLDLLLLEDLVVDDATLTLPHPRLHERRFVLEPLSEIAGDVIHPVWGSTIAELARRVATHHSGETVVRVGGPDWLRSSWPSGSPGP